MILNDLGTLLIKAKSQLMRQQPFFGTLIAQLPIMQDDSIPTACTNGEWIKVNPTYIRSLKFGQVIGLLCHEALHAGLLHMVRVGDRDPRKFNIAADYAINPLILEQNIKLPAGALNDYRYHGMSAEEIYPLLDDDEGARQFSNGIGEDIEAPGKPMDAATLKAKEQEAKQRMAAARMSAEKAGNFGGGLKRLVDDLLETKVAWQDLLQTFASERAYDDYVWSRPNRRFVGQDLFLPTLYSETLPPLLICVDTSGSINQKLLSEFAAEINGIREDCNPSKTFVAYVDTKVRRIEVLERDDVWAPEPAGGGGTNFTGVWNQALESEELDDTTPCAAIFFTDMGVYGDSWDKEPDFPVLWIDWKDGTTTAPYGETIRIAA